MYESIYAQPGAIRLVLRGNAETLKVAAQHLKAVDRVLLSGIGTSWHACLVGELLLSRVGRLGHSVRAFHSFEFKNYWPDPDPKTGVIVVSHRGTKRFSLEALQKAKAGGGIGIAITVLVRRNAAPYATVSIAGGNTVSSAVSGASLAPLQPGDLLTLDITGVGSTSPGQDLSLFIRL